MALTEARKAYLAEWRERRREHLRSYHTAWRRSHGAEPRSEMRHGTFYAYNQGCRCDPCVERTREQGRKWRAAHPEKVKQQEARQRVAHPESAATRTKAWRESDKGKAWAEGYRAQQRENHRRWYYDDIEATRSKKVVTQARRRARKKGASGTASYVQVMARVAFYGFRCYLCGAPWEHIDHVMPLARSGSNWPANLRPICADCNYRKHTKHLKEVSRNRLAVCA